MHITTHSVPHAVTITRHPFTTNTSSSLGSNKCCPLRYISLVSVELGHGVLSGAKLRHYLIPHTVIV